MKVYGKIIIGVLIIFLILLHRYLFQAREAFFDESSKYTALKNRITTELGPYCRVANTARNELKTQLSESGNPSDDMSLNDIYKTIYSCTDSMASSRQTCKRLIGFGPNTSMTYVSCNTYMQLPDWSDDASISVALMKITDDLPERMIREADWIFTKIKKIQEVLASGANPPTNAPSKEDLDKFNEGFSGYCSAEAIKAKKIMQEAKTCSIADISSEIARINRLLDNPDLKKILSLMNGLYEEMIKLQSDLDKLKNGELYDWQKDPPKKSYAQFKGGDRSAAFIFSMQQNQ
jgi:hypothetical protein